MDNGYLYFISDGEYVKIGKTKNIKNRMKALRTANPRDLTLIRYVYTDDWLSYNENKFHKIFSKYRIKNTEWFDKCVLNFIEGKTDTEINLVGEYDNAESFKRGIRIIQKIEDESEILKKISYERRGIESNNDVDIEKFIEKCIHNILNVINPKDILCRYCYIRKDLDEIKSGSEMIYSYRYSSRPLAYEREVFEIIIQNIKEVVNKNISIFDCSYNILSKIIRNGIYELVKIYANADTTIRNNINDEVLKYINKAIEDGYKTGQRKYWSDFDFNSSNIASINNLEDFFVNELKKNTIPKISLIIIRNGGIINE